MLIIKIHLLSAQTYRAATVIPERRWSLHLHGPCLVRSALRGWTCTIPGKRRLCSSWKQASITPPWLFQPFLCTCTQIIDVKDQGELVAQREEQSHLMQLEPSPSRAWAQGTLWVVFLPLFAWFCFGLAAIEKILTGNFQINACNEPRFRLTRPLSWINRILFPRWKPNREIFLPRSCYGHFWRGRKHSEGGNRKIQDVKTQSLRVLVKSVKAGLALQLFVWERWNGVLLILLLLLLLLPSSLLMSHLKLM